MTDADIAQLTPLLQQAQRIGKAQVGMPHHAEHMGHTPVHHGLCHEIADRGCVLQGFLHRHVNTVIALLNRVSQHAVVMGAG